MSYTIDVYRNEVKAEKNFFKYALFVSFFPQLVAGPIEKSKNLLGELNTPKKFNVKRLQEVFLIILWGFFLKIVLADRIGIFVDTIYNDYTNYPGFFLIIATILFSVQIYCDFAGYSTIAIGTSKILGIELMENFESPYLSTSVTEFWRRWHISLSTWFKDYLYIPLGGSKRGKIRKYVNKMIVFLASGLWHGASISFIVWGGLNGFYQILGEVLKPIRDKIIKVFKLHKNSLGNKLFSILMTFVLIDFSWIFFRAPSTSTAISIIKSIFTAQNPWILFDGSLYKCGLDIKNFHFMIISIVILMFVDYMKYKKIKIHKIILRQNFWFRCLFVWIAICIILIFGKWGPAFNNANFIYFQF